MKRTALIALAGAAGLSLAAPGHAQIVPYSQDFENLDRNSLTALEDDGWVFFGNVFDASSNYLFGYGVFPAPNDAANPNISVISESVGGNPPNGDQGLVVFNDYNNLEQHQNNPTNIVEANVFREQTITAGDIGSVWEFSFTAAPGDDLSGTSSTDGLFPAAGFIKTIDPNNNFALTNFVNVDTSALPAGNSSFSLEIDLSDPALEGQFLQIGFLSQAAGFQLSAVNYDDLNFALAGSGVLEGDYDGNGFVSQADLDLVLLNWGDGTLPGGFDATAIPGGGPFDSLISQNELDGVLLNWGNGTPPASVAAVPEPTTAALLGLAGFAMLRRRSA